MSSIFFRILLGISIFGFVIAGWWFVALPLALVGIWAFGSYVEIIAAGVAYDALFGMVPGFGVRGYLATILSVLIFAIASVFKRYVRR